MTGVALASNDGGIMWRNLAQISGEPFKCVTAVGSRFVLAGLTNNVRISDDNGVTWTVSNDAAGVAQCMASDGYVLVALNQNDAQCKVSTDGGRNWLARTLPTDGFARTYNRAAFNGYVWAVASLSTYVTVITVSNPRVF